MPVRALAIVAILSLLPLACAPAGQTGASRPRESPSPSATTPGNTLPPPVASPTPTPDPNPVPVTRSYAVVTGGVTSNGGNYSVSLVAADGTVAATTQSALRGGFLCASSPEAAVLPLLSVSTSNSRAYFLDGLGNVRFLAPNGATGIATTVPGAHQVATPFSVSPDDKRIAVNVIEYTNLPIRQRLYVEDLAGGGNRIEVFSGGASGPFNSSAIWPVGWRNGNLVLAFHNGTCTQGSGRGIDQPSSFHVSDAATGRRVTTIGADAGGCQMVDPQPSGLACNPSDNTTQLYDWQGIARQRLICPDGLSNLSPDGAKLLCGLFSTTKASVVGVDGTRIELAGPPGPGGFIDSDHVYLGGATQQDQARVITLSTGQSKAVAVVGVFRGRLPGTLNVGRGT